MGKQVKSKREQEWDAIVSGLFANKDNKTIDSLKVSNTALEPKVEQTKSKREQEWDSIVGRLFPNKDNKTVQNYTQPKVPTPVNPMFMQLLQEEQKKQQLYQNTENQKQLQQLIDGIEGGKKNEGVVINRRPVYDSIPENRTGQEFITPTGEWQPTLEYQPREVQIGKLKGLQQKQDSGQPLTEEEAKMLNRLSIIQERKTLGNENRITDTAGSLTLQNIEPLISQFSGMHPATATVQGGGQLLRNIFNMDKQYNDGDAVRQGIDIALNTVGMGIQMIPKVAVISAIANNLKLFTGATGKTTGAWGIKDQKNIDVLTHYATMIPFGARVTTALIMSEQGAEGLKSALDKNMIPGLEGIREDDKMRIVEGASHALFFASLYGAGKIGGGIKNKIDNAVKTTLEKDFPRVFDQISTGNKNIQMSADDMRTFGSDLIPPKETTEGRRFDKFDKRYEESGYRNIDEYLAKYSPAERQQFMEAWGKYKERGNVDFFDFVDIVEGKKSFNFDPDFFEPQNKLIKVPPIDPKLNEMPETANTEGMLNRIRDKKLTPKQLEVVQDYLLRKGVPQDLIDQARGQLSEKPKEQPKQVQTKEQVKNDNVLQLEIMQKAGIPEAEMPDYALSSVADGKLLRSYITEVKNGELTVDEAVERVKTDYEKMKTGEKEGKFIEPEQPQTVEPKNVALSTPNQAIKEIEQTGGKVVKVYHGGSGVQSLRNKFSILTPEQKQSLPSSHVGLTGLSMTTNPDIARRYSQYIGGTSEIFEATINPNAKILTIDTKGEGIDGVYSDNEINDIANKGYDAIQDISNGAESEFRALTSNAILDKEIKFAKHPDGTLKNKNEYTQEEWKAYTTSVINKKLSETPKPKQERPKETPKTEPNLEGKDPIVEQYVKEYIKIGQSSEQTARQYVARIKTAIDDKDYNTLTSIMHLGNKTSRKLFADVTGIKLPNTEGETRKVIAEFTGYKEPAKPTPMSKEESIKKMKDAQTEKILNTRINYGGDFGTVTRKQFVEKATEKGYKPEEHEVKAIKDVSRTRFNRMDRWEQDAFEKKQREAGMKTEYILKNPNDSSYYTVTKAEYDYAKSLGTKEIPKVESKPETINPRIKADDLEKLLSQKQKEMSPKEFFDYLDNVREKLVLTEQSKNDFPTVKRREVLRRFTQEATRQNPTEKDKIRKIADVAIANFIEQPGFSVVEFMTASARAVATKRLEQAGYKTTKMVEGEKTKFALKIEKPKQEATQTKPKEPELTEEQEDKILRKTEFADIINVPIKDIHIDLKRFQNRKSAYAEAIVKGIVDNFKPWSFKQITLWKDPKDGKDYVISGHSRLEGIIKRGDVDKIPSQYFPGTEAEARLYGKLEGNRENQNESLIEDVSAYKIAKESQLPKAELLRAFKTEGKINKLERLSYLDEKGEFLNNLDSEAAQSFPNIERNAGWVGELRKEYPVLTLAHENEIFDFFYRGKKENTLIRKEDFIDLVEKRISDGAFKSDQALLLDKVDNTGARGRADTREAQKQIDKLIENNKHYEALMKNADEAERDDYQAKLLRNLREIDKLKGGVDEALNSQMSLFQKTKILAALHNITESKLLNAGKMGGLPMPSIAITKPEFGFTDFGEITLIGDKNLIDPAASRGNKVYGADVYSPRYPSLSYEIKNKKVLEDLAKDFPDEMRTSGWAKISGDIKERGLREAKDNPFLMYAFLKKRGIDTTVQREPGYSKATIDAIREIEGYDYLSVQDNEAIKEQLSELYIKENKLDIDDPNIKEIFFDAGGKISEQALRYFFNDVKNETRNKKTIDERETLASARRQIENNGLKDEFNTFAEDIYDKLGVEEKIFKGFSYTGKRRYVPHTLENVIKEMKSEKGVRGKENFFYGGGTVRAMVTPQFKSVGQIKANEDKIIRSKDFDIIRDEVNSELSSLGGDVKKFYKYRDDIERSLGEELLVLERRGESESFNKLDPETHGKVKLFAEKLRNLPTEYFEAKLERAVGLSEFNTAIVPETISPQAIKVLESNGIKIVKYTNDQDRIAKTYEVAKQNNSLFQSEGQSESKPFSQLPKAEQERLTKIITDRVIGLVIPDRTVKANVNAITELVSEVVRFHPDRADEGTMWHEGTHLGLKSSTRPSEAKAILLQMRDSQGKRLWDGKGDPFDVTNPSLKEAHEQFAEDFGDYLNDKKAFDEKYKNNPLKKRIAEVFERIKEIYRKVVNALKGEGFADAKNWYRRFYEGNLKKEAEKRFREEDIKTEKDLVLAEREGRKQDLYQITGEKGMANYDKANNTHLVRNNLSVAKQMDKQKLTPGQIRLATGWEKGVEGKWRYEIPDIEPRKGVSKALFNEAVKDWGDPSWGKEGNAVEDLYGELGYSPYNKEIAKQVTEAFKQNDPELLPPVRFTQAIINWGKRRNEGAAKLVDVIGYKELFKAYPELEDVKVVFGSIKENANFNPKTNTITISKLLEGDEDMVKSSLSHEIQHAIQDIEGFAYGGTPEIFKKDWERENRRVEELNKQLSAASKSGNKKLYNELLDERSGVVKRIKELEDEYGVVGYKPYKRLAGEVEARNVQTRLKLTPEERRTNTLQDTEDVKREDQIIRDSYGEASMASEPDPIGLNKAEIKELREELELDKLPKPERKRMENSLNEAKLRGLKDTAMITADEVIRTKRVIDEVEHAGMVMKAKDLRDEINDIQRQVGTAVDAGDSLGIRRLIARRDDLIEQMDKLTMASDIAGTGIARALSIRRMRVEGANYDFASVMQRAKAQKGGRLTEKEAARLTELTTKYEQAEEQLKTLHAEYDKMVEENEKLKAQKVTEAEVRKTSVERRASVQREKIVKEREDIKAQLRGLGFRVNDVAGLSAEGTYLIGKLALNYIKEGVVDLNEVVQKVMEDVPDITERDVWRGINSKDPTRQVKAARETTKKVNQIKTQARLLEKIRLAEEGIFDKPRSKPQQDVEIKRLKDTLTSLRKEAFKSELEAKKLERALQTINELQDQLANMRRSIRKKQPEPTADLKAAKEKIKELRKIMNMDDKLADLNEQLRTKEFKVKEPRMVTPTTPEIDRKAVEIYTLKKKINEEVRKLTPLTIADYGMEVMNTLRTAKASMDMSAALRQAFFPSARRPLLAMQTQTKAIEAFFSQNAYDEIQYNIESHPNHYIRQMAKLEMTDIDSSPSHREEMFASQFAEKIPIYKHGVIASNRHMVTTLNLIRVGVFDEFLETYPNATMEELRAWADYVNVVTGRGNLGKFTAAANVLSMGLFSPRFAISRLQTPFLIFKHWKEPRVRKEIAKDYAHFAGMAMTVLGLAALAGLQVGLDPEESDFGKIRVGNTRVDIFAGTQQPMRLLIRLGKTVTDRVGLTEANKKEENPLEMIARFGAYKLAPVITLPVELIRGRSIIGEEREPTESAVNALIPMFFEDTKDAYEDGGIERAAWAGTLNFFGMSNNTYEKKAKASPKTGRENRQRGGRETSRYQRRGRR